MQFNNDTLTKDWVKLHSTKHSHKKMYKAKKQWVVASATLIAIMGTGAILNGNAHADSASARLDDSNDNLTVSDNTKVNNKNNINTDYINSKLISNRSHTVANRNQKFSNDNESNNKANDSDGSNNSNNSNNTVFNAGNNTMTNSPGLNSHRNASNNRLGIANNNININSKGDSYKAEIHSQVAQALSGGNTQTDMNSGGKPSERYSSNDTNRYFDKANSVSKNLIRNNPFTSLNSAPQDIEFHYTYYLQGDPSKIVADMYSSGSGVTESVSAGLLNPIPLKNYHYVNPSQQTNLTPADDGNQVNIETPVAPNPGHTPGKFETITINMEDFGSDKEEGSPHTFQVSFNSDQLNPDLSSPSRNYDINSVISHGNNGPAATEGFYYMDKYLSAGVSGKNKINPNTMGYTSFDIFGANGVPNQSDQQHTDFDPIKSGGTYTIWVKDSSLSSVLPYEYVDEDTGESIGKTGFFTLHPGDVGKKVSAIINSNMSTITSNAPVTSSDKLDSSNIPIVNNGVWNASIKQNQDGPLIRIPIDKKTVKATIPIKVYKENYKKQNEGVLASANLPMKEPMDGTTVIDTSNGTVANLLNQYESQGYMLDSGKTSSYTIKLLNNNSYTANGTPNKTLAFYLYNTNARVSIPVKFEKENYKKQDEGQFPSTGITITESGTAGQQDGVISLSTPKVQSVISTLANEGYLIDPDKPNSYSISLTGNNSYTANGTPEGTPTFYLYDNQTTNSTNVYYQLENANGNPIGSRIKLKTVADGTHAVGMQIPTINAPSPAEIPAIAGKGYSLDENKLPAMPVMAEGNVSSPSSITFYYYQTKLNNNIQVYYQRDGKDNEPVEASSRTISATPDYKGEYTVQVSAPSGSELQGWSLVSPAVINKTISTGSPSPIKIVFHYTQSAVSNTVKIQTEEKHADGSITPGPSYTKLFKYVSPKSPQQTINGNDYVPDSSNGISWILDDSNPKYPAMQKVKMTGGSQTNPGTVYFLYDENKVQPEIRIDRIEETSPGVTANNGSFTPYIDSGHYSDGQEIAYNGNTLNPDPEDYQLDTKTGPATVWAKISGNGYEPDNAKGTQALKLYYTLITRPKPAAPVNASVEVTLYSVPNPANGNPPVAVDALPVEVSLLPGQTITLNANQPRFINDTSLPAGSTPVNGSDVVISRDGDGLNKYAVNFYYRTPYEKESRPQVKMLQPIQFTYTDGAKSWKSPLVYPADRFDDPDQINAETWYPTNLVGYYRINGIHNAGFSNRFQEITVPIIRDVFNEDVKINLIKEDTRGHANGEVSAPSFTHDEHQGDEHYFNASDYSEMLPGYIPDQNHKGQVEVTFGPGDNNASTEAVNLYYSPADENVPVSFRNVSDNNHQVGSGTARYKFGTRYTTEDIANRVGVPAGYVLVPSQTAGHIVGDPNSKQIPGNSTVNVSVAPESCPPIHVVYLDQHGKLIGRTDVSGIRYSYQTASQLGNDGWSQTVIPDTYSVVPGQNKEYQFGPDSGKTVDVEAVGKEKNLNYHIQRYLESPDGEVVAEDSPIELPARMQYGNSETFNISDYPIAGYTPDPYHNGTSTITLHEDGHASISNDAFYYKADEAGVNHVQPVVVNYLTGDNKILLSRTLYGYMGQRINVVNEDSVPDGYRLDGNQQTEHMFSQAPAKPMNLYVSAVPVKTDETDNHSYHKINHGTTVNSPHYISQDNYVSSHKQNTVQPGRRHHFKWFWVVKTLHIHTGMRFTRHNDVITIRPQQHFTFKILRVCHYHGRIRYMIRYSRHHIGYVTGNRHWTQNAYFSRKDLRKLPGKKHYIKFYRTTDFIHQQTKFRHLRKQMRIRKGSVMRIYGIKHIGPKYGGMTRFILGDGRYVTSNKNYVKIIK